MSHRIAIVLVSLAGGAGLVGLGGCDSMSSGGTGGGAKVAESGPAKGSAGGFSATMSAELARAGIGEQIAAPPAEGSAAGSATSLATGSAMTGTAGSAAAGAAMTGAVGSATTPAGSAATGSSAMGAAGSAPTPAGSAAGSPTPAGAGSAQPAAVTTPVVVANETPVTKAGPSSVKAIGAVPAPASRAYVKPSADIAGIKLDLEPNWERDMGEAGTFSLVVKLPSTNDTRMFMVRYGFEDQSVPHDCDQYRKYLEDRGFMKVTLNRQRGAACYLEGTDQGGLVAYRFLLLYGGKKLLCHGSLYKDPASAALGDLRDKVLLQAKKICETLAL